jgi:hypothetical protein
MKVAENASWDQQTFSTNLVWKIKLCLRGIVVYLVSVKGYVSAVFKAKGGWFILLLKAFWFESSK